MVEIVDYEKSTRFFVTALMKELYLKKHEFQWVEKSVDLFYPTSSWMSSSKKRKDVVDNIMLNTTFYRKRNGRSNAGRYEMNICTTCWNFNHKYWIEYKSVNKDPQIGQIKVNDNEDILFLLVAHELSHYIQYSYRHLLPKYLYDSYNTQKYDKSKLKSMKRPHGLIWQEIYRIMRINVVNPFIKQKTEMMEVAHPPYDENDYENMQELRELY